MNTILFMKNKFFTTLSFEFKKIPPFNWAALFVLFILINIFGAFISVNSVELVDTERIRNAIIAYQANPSAFIKSYDEWQATYNLYEQALLETAKSTSEKIVEISPPEQVYESQVYDYQSYNRFFDLLYRKNTYISQIAHLIDTAEQNIFAASDNVFQKNYNKKVIETYVQTSNNVYIGLEDTIGWDIFLESPVPGLSTLLALILICGHTFCLEYSTNMNGIIFNSRYGRVRIFITKLIYLFLLSFIFLALSECITLLVVLKTVGLSSPWNSIQAFSQYTYCPYAISVIAFTILSFIAKLGILWVLCVLTSFISICFQKLVLVYILSGFSSIAAYIILQLNPNFGSLAYRLHPFVHLTSTDFFKRYAASNIFSRVVNHEFLVPIIYCLVFIALLVLLFSTNTEIKKSHNNVRIGLNKPFTNKCTVSKGQKYSLRLSPYEIRKQLQVRSLLLCFFFLVSQTIFTYVVYSREHSESDNILYEYLLYLEGPISVEKTEYLQKERINFDIIFSTKDTVELSYSNGEIDSKEYLTYLQSYERALSHSEVLDSIIEYDNYLNNVSLTKKVPAYFLYRSGYENLFNSGNDILMLLIIFFLATEFFSCEYTSKTSAYPAITLISTTKYGRRQTTIAKYIGSLTITSLIYLCTNTFRFIILFSHWYFPALYAPLYSLEQFKNAPDISILSYLLFYILARSILILIIVSLILAITKKAKNGYLVFLICSIWLLCPYIFEYFDIEFPHWLNFNYLYNLCF